MSLKSEHPSNGIRKPSTAKQRTTFFPSPHTHTHSLSFLSFSSSHIRSTFLHLGTSPTSRRVLPATAAPARAARSTTKPPPVGASGAGYLRHALHSAATRGTPYRRAYSFICVLWLWGSPGTVKNHPRPPVALSLFPSSRSSPSHPRRPAPTSTKNQPTTPSSRHQRPSPIAYRPSAPSPSASLRLSPPRRPLSRLLPSTTPSITPPPARLAPRPRLLGSPPVTPTPVGCPAPVARPGG